MIKETLKQNGVTISEFAQILQISRPTLDNYIKTYENRQPLPNDKYRIVFDILFSEQVESKEEFNNKITQIKMILHRDKILGAIDLDPEKTDLLTNIIEAVKTDLYRENCDLNLHRFVIMFLNSYNDGPVFKSLVKYFLTLNSIMNVNELKESDKLIISNYFRLFSNQLNNKLIFDSSSYSRFIKRIDEIKSDKEKDKNDFKYQISKILEKRIDELVEQGIDVKNINIQNLLANILNDYNY